MTAPDLLERVRMALAEAGYPNADVVLNADGRLTLPGYIPFEPSWRAVELAWSTTGGRAPCCLACSVVASETEDAAVFRACLADRPLVRDCGVAR